MVVLNVYLMFTPIRGEEDETHFDGSHIFQMGWFNHQLEMHSLGGGTSAPRKENGCNLSAGNTTEVQKWHPVTVLEDDFRVGMFA